MTKAVPVLYKPSGEVDLIAMAHSMVAALFYGDQTMPLFFKSTLTLEEQIQRGKPRPYIDVTRHLLALMQGRMIVEIGSMRQMMRHSINEISPTTCCNDGHSTMFWAHTGCEVHTVDIDPRCRVVVDAIRAHFPKVHGVTGDAIAFLRAFEGVIDLLYLDAWDVNEGDPYAEKHLEAYEAARHKLAPRAIVLIDDTDILCGGKGRLAVPAAIRDGFMPIIAGRQTLLVRDT